MLSPRRSSALAPVPAPPPTLAPTLAPLALLALALRLARRELRGGLKGLGILIACLALGVGAIVAVGSVAQSIRGGLADNGRALLGGDLEAQLVQRPATPAEQAALSALGRVSVVRSLRAMARTTTGEATLVEIKAVDDAYPLVGTLAVTPAFGPATLAVEGGAYGAVVGPDLLARLGVAVGDRLAIGEATVIIRGVIDDEPDRATEAFALGPRLLISGQALEATGLIRIGSLYNSAYRVLLSHPDQLAVAHQRLEQDFPEAGWRLRDREKASPGAETFINRLTQFMTLAGLASLVIGGLGVATAIGSHMAGKGRTIATLKAVGAPARLIFLIYLTETLALALIGIVIGLTLGASAPFILSALFGSALPVPPRLSLYSGALALGGLYGLLVTLLFTLPPLAHARLVSPARLFRGVVSPPAAADRRLRLVQIGLVAAIAAIAMATSDNPLTGGAVLLAVAALLLLLHFCAQAITALARRSPGGGFGIAGRLALANLRRPGAATRDAVMALGLGLTLLITLALVARNLDAELRERLPDQAPSFFFVDVQSGQIDQFRQLVAGVAGTSDLVTVPSLRGRITRINGQPADQWPISPDGRWVLRGDRGVTYAARPPAGSSVIAGDWWPADYRGPPLISFDAKLAEAMGIGIGDKITVNILGREITATIANLRRIDWTSLNINFVLIFSPNTLAGAPHSFLATLHSTPAAEDPLYRAVTRSLPNVSVVRVKEALAAADALLGKLALAIGGAAAVCLLTGLLVLAGAFAAGHRARLRDAAILKVLGAGQRRLLAIFLCEYGLIGLVTGLLAAILANGAAFAVIHWVMNGSWRFEPGITLAAAVIGAGISIIIGLISGRGLLRQSPARLLRGP